MLTSYHVVFSDYDSRAFKYNPMRRVVDAQCEAGFKLRLVGAPNQSPEREIFPKDHPRLRSFVTDFNKTLATIRKIVDADDCAPLVEPSARLVTRQTSP